MFGKLKSMLVRKLIEHGGSADVCRAGAGGATGMIVRHDDLAGMEPVGFAKQRGWPDDHARRVLRCDHVDPQASSFHTEEQDKHVFKRCVSKATRQEAGELRRDAGVRLKAVLAAAMSTCPLQSCLDPCPCMQGLKTAQRFVRKACMVSDRSFKSQPGAQGARAPGVMRSRAASHVPIVRMTSCIQDGVRIIKA